MGPRQRDAAGAAHAAWECGGNHTRARLAELVRLYAPVYGCADDATEIEAAIVAAVPDWYWAE